ncbi:alcohol dehydrogenase-like protein SE_1777 [Seminavis robusta]|uniref:Alcohol dehydrogenase-like protein SE_1777 n=1 Tax=Seminavis robusta TaxID=568900 RepID=A0A9N8HUR3_9STRA|nr:alcohol dehydrogenase-like protein SE_1777 [Seminavis robusta]|eukprot:Sro1688_g291250.1 alcohol dehydrogenase-like protein SE_1777 (335) ;mRNA; f:14251-15326
MVSMKTFAVKEYKNFVKAVATNPIDYKRLANLGKHDEDFEAQEPLTVGWDASGVVEQVGDETSLFQVGDEVMFAGDFFRAGAFAEYVLVDDRIVAKKPSKSSWSEAAAIPLTSLTAWEALVDQLKIPEDPEKNKGKTILITGGAGGVASSAVQIAKKVLGLTVIATGSRVETVKYVKELGADHVINHRFPSMSAQVRSELDIENVDYIMHSVDLTPELFTEFVDLVKPFGGIVSVWPSATVDLMQLFWKSINFSAVLMFTRPTLKNDAAQRQHDILERVAELTDAGVLVSREKTTFKLTLDNLRKALELQASGKAVGKITLAFEGVQAWSCRRS